MTEYKPSARILGTLPDGTHVLGITLVIEADAAWNGWTVTAGQLASSICGRIDGAGFEVTEESLSAVTE